MVAASDERDKLERLCRYITRPAVSTERLSPAHRGRRQAARAEEPPANGHASMTWAQRLKRVFKSDIEICETCGGQMKVIASIEEPAVVKRILAPLDSHPGRAQHPEHPPRAPPQFTLPGLMD